VWKYDISLGVILDRNSFLTKNSILYMAETYIVGDTFPGSDKKLRLELLYILSNNDSS